MKKLILATALSVMPIISVSAQEVALETDEDKLSYALGMLMGERVLKNYGDSLNYDTIMAAMQAQHKGEET